MAVRRSWRGAADCKSVVERLGEFKSLCRHLAGVTEQAYVSSLEGEFWGFKSPLQHLCNSGGMEYAAVSEAVAGNSLQVQILSVALLGH